MKRLVLLGGGHAHVQVLVEIAREALPGVQVVLVTPYARQIYSGMVPGWVAGHYALDECAIALGPLAHAAGAELALASAVSVDAAQRSVTLSDGRVAEYDVLSIDTGSIFDRDAIAGAREHALFVRPIEHFVPLFEQVMTLASQRVLDIVVVGGGAAGFELAMALQHRLCAGGQERARIGLVTGDTAVLPGFGEALRRLAMNRLRRARITVLNQRCVEIGQTHVLLDNGARLACDVPLLALPNVAPAWARSSGLVVNEQGFISIGPSLQSVSHREVFAAGDVASRIDMALPRSGVFAVRAGPALALNLRRFLAAGELMPWKTSPRSLYLLSCGEQRAIMSWGSWCAQGRWAWAWKDWIDRRFIERYVDPTMWLPRPGK